MTDGTIHTTNSYAWGENTGWVDFASTAGDVHVTDAGLTGSAYGENIGWIDLATVTNDAEGDLDGYAWAENVGWIDFSGVSINEFGEFIDAAYGENIGWLIFDIDEGVVTDWRPASARDSGNGNSSGSSSRRRSGGGGSSLSDDALIASLIKRVEELKALLASLQNTNPSTCTFTRDLTLESTGDDVRCLQHFLIQQNKGPKAQALAANGATGYFGPLTQAALAEYQASVGIAPAAGYFGVVTRSFMSTH